jgi:hypothetical protein
LWAGGFLVGWHGFGFTVNYLGEYPGWFTLKLCKHVHQRLPRHTGSSNNQANPLKLDLSQFLKLFKNCKIAPSCDSLLTSSMHRHVLYWLYYIHCIPCIVLYALYSMHFFLCIFFYAFVSKHFFICIVLNALYAMHCNMCIVLFELYIVCIVLNALSYLHCIPRIKFNALFTLHKGRTLCTAFCLQTYVYFESCFLWTSILDCPFSFTKRIIYAMGAFLSCSHHFTNKMTFCLFVT